MMATYSPSSTEKLMSAGLRHGGPKRGEYLLDVVDLQDGHIRPLVLDKFILNAFFNASMDWFFPLRVVSFSQRHCGTPHHSTAGQVTQSMSALTHVFSIIVRHKAGAYLIPGLQTRRKRKLSHCHSINAFDGGKRRMARAHAHGGLKRRPWDRRLQISVRGRPNAGRLQILRPRTPVKPRSNTRGRSSARMPTPVSATSARVSPHPR